jgi:hypothetical protein
LIITFITVFLFGGLTSPLLSFFGLAGDENNPTEEGNIERKLIRNHQLNFIFF